MSELLPSTPGGQVLAIGVDLVHIPGFAEQLARPGSTFAQVFGAHELRVAAERSARRAEHLAGRWAAKEAFVKAWAQARYGQPPLLSEAEFNWAELQVRADVWGRVAYELSPALHRRVVESLGPVKAHLSISHDADYATATCMLLTAAQ